MREVVSSVAKPMGGFILTIAVIAIFSKIPVLLLFVGFMALLVLGTVAIVKALPSPKNKRKAVTSRGRVRQPEKKFIAGVGEVDWVTDPAQLEAGQLLSLQELKVAENLLLHTDPSEWVKMGEKVATSEEEAANTPLGQGWIDRESKTRPTHAYQCRCQDCHKDRLMQQIRKNVAIPPAVIGDQGVEIIRRRPNRYAKVGIVTRVGTDGDGIYPGIYPVYRTYRTEDCR